jgi:DNA-binding response OmpR family regulator
MKILVVEDHLDLADMTCRVLRDVYGHEVGMADTGAKALQAARTEVPDLVLIDINLPDMSGYDVARNLRSNPDFDRTLLVAVTGFGNLINPEFAKDVGLDAIFQKPLDFDVLEHLERR